MKITDGGPLDDWTEEPDEGREGERLSVITAMKLAQERREEVLAVVAAAKSDDEARDAVTALLGLSYSSQASAVLDMQLRRMTVTNRDRLLAEYHELRTNLTGPT